MDRSRSSTRFRSPGTTCSFPISSLAVAARRLRRRQSSRPASDADIIAAQAKLKPDMPWIRTADGVKVSLLNEQTQFLGGEEIDLVFRLMTPRPMRR